MELSGKALGFVASAVETQIARFQAICDDTATSDDDCADASNDRMFLEAILSDMREAIARERKRIVGG